MKHHLRKHIELEPDLLNALKGCGWEDVTEERLGEDTATGVVVFWQAGANYFLFIGANLCTKRLTETRYHFAPYLAFPGEYDQGQDPYRGNNTSRAL